MSEIKPMRGTANVPRCPHCGEPIFDLEPEPDPKPVERTYRLSRPVDVLSGQKRFQHCAGICVTSDPEVQRILNNYPGVERL